MAGRLFWALARRTEPAGCQGRGAAFWAEFHVYHHQAVLPFPLSSYTMGALVLIEDEALTVGRQYTLRG